MGKQKKEKAELKKAARIQATIREALIYAANNATPDTLMHAKGSLIPEEGLTFCSHGNVYRISVCTNAGTLTKHEKSAIFKLVEKNLKTAYEASQGQMPWNAGEKIRELFHSTSRLLLVKRLVPSPEHPENEMETFAGFVHFRFEADDEGFVRLVCLDEPKDAVLYLYEIQLTAATQRCGLGSHMMKITELIARQLHMPKIMLTVFKHNISAMKFYIQKMGYVIDTSSPSQFGDKNCTYEILSKFLGESTPEMLESLTNECKEGARNSMLSTQNDPCGAAEDVDRSIKTSSAREEANDVEGRVDSWVKVVVEEKNDEAEDDGDEECVADEGVNLLVEVTRVFFEEHDRMPSMEEIKDTLRSLEEQDKQVGGCANEVVPIDLTCTTPT